MPFAISAARPRSSTNPCPCAQRGCSWNNQSQVLRLSLYFLVQMRHMLQCLKLPPPPYPMGQEILWSHVPASMGTYLKHYRYDVEASQYFASQMLFYCCFNALLTCTQIWLLRWPWTATRFHQKVECSSLSPHTELHRMHPPKCAYRSGAKY